MKRWPTGEWINDGHRAYVWFDPDEGEHDVDFMHPLECPYEDRDWGGDAIHPYTVRHFLCPLEYELSNVGLTHPFKDSHGCANHDEEIPVEAWEAFFRARDGESFAVEYYYEAGWTPDTPAGPSEYEWYFTWRPVELARLVHGHSY